MSNKDDIKKFIEDNIEQINTKISEFSKKKNPNIEYDATDIKRCLLEKFRTELDDAKKQQLLREFASKNYAKASIIEIATNNGYYHKDLEMFYQNSISSELSAIPEYSSSFVSPLILEHVFTLY